MTKPRVFGKGWPFDPRFSSNSTRRPELFDWTDDPSEATVDVCVCADGGIFNPPEWDGPKIAWFVESPAILVRQTLSILLKQRLDFVCDQYELILTSDRSMCLLDSKFRYHPAGSNLPWIPSSAYGLSHKTKLCSMIASDKTLVEGHRVRQRYAAKWVNDLDLYGGACGSRRIGGGGAHPDKREGLAPYRFSVAMENCRVPLYYSEKITDCFATGTVPIYWGSDAIGEVFDEEGIIPLTEDLDLTGLDIDLYQSMLPAIERNLEIVTHLESADDLLCRLYLRQG